jgi:hypothetical protein
MGNESLFRIDLFSRLFWRAQMTMCQDSLELCVVQYIVTFNTLLPFTNPPSLQIFRIPQSPKEKRNDEGLTSPSGHFPLAQQIHLSHRITKSRLRKGTKSRRTCLSSCQCFWITNSIRRESLPVPASKTRSYCILLFRSLKF